MAVLSIEDLPPPVITLQAAGSHHVVAWVARFTVLSLLIRSAYDYEKRGEIKKSDNGYSQSGERDSG